jgi:uncharacterized protein YdhG (YjbR/CyaY superfamily)
VRATIRTAVPDALESISYGIPTYKYRGRPLVYFAAAKGHCALYATSAGTVRFTPAEPLTPERVTALVLERVAAVDQAEQERRAKARARSRR